MRFHPESPRLRAMLMAMCCGLLSSCSIIIQQSAPKPPTPLQLATSLQVVFDYSGLMVEGMGGAKSEADWVAAKTAEDPEYPKTWAELKAKWEDAFMRGASSGSPVPVSRAQVATAAATGVAPAPVLLAQAEVTAGGAAETEPSDPAIPEDETQVATDATPAPDTAAAPQPQEPEAPKEPEFDGVLTVRVSLASFKLGKYIPMFTSKSRIHVMNAWLASGRMVEESQDQLEFAPTLKTPSVFQHLQTMGVDAGGRAAAFLRKHHRR